MTSTFAIRWTLPVVGEGHDCPPDEMVWVSVEKFDAAWRETGHLYISPRGTSGAIGCRYEMIPDRLKCAESTVMPSVSFDEDGKLGFSDGRHRFAWLRDHGILSLPLAVPPDQAGRFRVVFGTEAPQTTVVSLASPQS